MAKSSACKLVSAAFLVAVCGRVSSSVPMEALAKCSEIAGVYKSLSRPVSAVDCRAPRSALERAMFDRFESGHSEACLLREPPPGFQDHSCVRPRGSGGTQVTCFRPSTLADVEAYKHRYPSEFAAPTAQYMAAAKACPGSTSDANPAQRYQLPTELSLIARFEFGFIVGMDGGGRLRNGATIHGFASTDPTLPSDAPKALEFLHVYIGAPERGEGFETTAIGSWVLEVGQDRDLSSEFNKRTRRAGAPARMEIVDFQIKRIDGLALAQSRKIAMLNGFVDEVVDGLESEGFELASDSELEKFAGMDVEGLRQAINKKNSGFGNRDMPLVTASSIHILISERRPACTARSQGAIGAYVLSLEPIPDVQSDFGGFAVMILRLGACAGETSAANRYSRGLMEDATSTLADALRNE